MGRPCIVCTHQKKDEIEQMIRAVPRVPFREISLKFFNEENKLMSIWRHTTEHLKMDTCAYLAERRAEGAKSYAEWFDETKLKVDKMVAAAEREVQDPDNPEQYSFAPHANNVRVIYETMTEKGWAKTSGMLDELIDAVMLGGSNPLKVQLPDSRKVLLESIREARAFLQELGSVEGVYKQPETNPADVQREESKKLYAQALINDESKPEITNMDEAFAYMDKLNSKFQEVQEKGMIG